MGSADSSADTYDSFEEEQTDTAQWPLRVCLANMVAFIVGWVIGITGLVGLSAFTAVALMLATYLTWEMGRHRSARYCALGTLPLWVLIITSL